MGDRSSMTLSELPQVQLLSTEKGGQQLIKFCSKHLSGSEEFFEHGFVGVRADDGDGEA
jgi:hypothetical protein